MTTRRFIQHQLLGVALFLTGVSSMHAQAFLHLPVEGEYGVDFILVNYVDWGPGPALYDHQCGSKTYDGHEGTDFVLRSFRAMDEGVYVLAAADGVVTFIQDGLFDREKESDVSKGFGNYLAIAHANGFYSYYAHLATHSVMVAVGDTVQAGERIARVGSSGNSSDPHLHFELWFDSIQVVDPFAGVCGNAQSLWLETPVYDTTFGVWTSGLTHFIPTLDTLREELPHRDHFSDADEAVTYWSILYGLRQGDDLTLQWFTPDGELWFSFSYELEWDAWYFYYWSYIFVPAIPLPGDWEVHLLRNGAKVDEQTFRVGTTATHPVQPAIRTMHIYPNPVSSSAAISWVTEQEGNTTVEIRDEYGGLVRILTSGFRTRGEHTVWLDTSGLPGGTFFCTLRVGDVAITRPVILVR